MKTVKTRKIGSSVTITIPNEFDIPAGKEFIVQKGRDNVIMLVPKIPDPFDGTIDLRMEDDFDGVRLVDSEI